VTQQVAQLPQRDRTSS